MLNLSLSDYKIRQEQVLNLMLNKTTNVASLTSASEPYIIKTPIEGLLIIKRPRYADFRGSFQELCRVPDLNKATKGTKIAQSQISISKNNVLRGIHAEPRDKIITPIVGKMLSVIVDLRKDSATFKKWIGFEFDNSSVDTPYTTMLVPNGCGNSFLVTGEDLIYHYTYSSVYDPKWSGMGVRYNDPDLAIDWPIKEPILSDRDKNMPSLQEFIEKYS